MGRLTCFHVANVRCVLVAPVALALALAPSSAHAKEPTKSGAAAHAHDAHERASAGARSKRSRHHDDKDDAKSSKGVRPKSIGAPNKGKLDGAVRLKKSAHVAIREGAYAWGTPELVHALRDAADDVASKHKGSILFVGDLSAKGGGPLSGHNSHQSGRDVDIGFYVTNSKGKNVNAKRFMAFGADGTARDGGWGRFDDARNWALVESLLKDDKANIRFIFVSHELRARLIKYASKKKVSEELMERAQTVMMTPEHVEAHDEHFHVRIACPKSSKDCTEESIGGVSADEPYETPSRSAEPSADSAPAPSHAAPQGADAPQHE